MYVSGMDRLVSRTYRLIWVGVSSGHSLVSLVLHSLLTNLPSLDRWDETFVNRIKPVCILRWVNEQASLHL